MRLIDADTIPWEGFPNDCGEYHEDYVEKRVVDKMPTIEARPVVRGDWYGVGNMWMCTVCEDQFYVMSNYCPNCGADNRGDDNE